MPTSVPRSILFVRLALSLGICSAILAVWQTTASFHGIYGDAIAGEEGWLMEKLRSNSTVEAKPNFTVDFRSVQGADFRAIADADQRPVATHHPLVFHFVHTTDDSTFRERNLRALESVLYHHPDAHIVVHVHNLTESPLRPLLEQGYQISFRPINLTATADALLTALPTHLLDPDTITRFVREIPSNYSATPYWYTNQSNLLRLALMFLEGGVYLDTDVVLVRPLYFGDEPNNNTNDNGLRTTNVLGWEDKHRVKINMAVMKFSPPGNPFLADCLREFFQEFQPLIWGHNGPKLVTRVFMRWSNRTQMTDGDTNEVGETADPGQPIDVLYRDDAPNHSLSKQASRSETAAPILNVLGYKAFYPIRANNVRKWCLKYHSREATLRKTDRIRAGSFAVHTNNKNTGTALVQPGSVCDWLYRSFRVLGGPPNASRTLALPTKPESPAITTGPTNRTTVASVSMRANTVRPSPISPEWSAHGASFTSSSQEIPWMRAGDGDFFPHDAFSGMWWMPIEIFQDLAVDEFTTVESTSTLVFRRYQENLTMTRDWMDASVEHTSKWWKQIFKLSPITPPVDGSSRDIFREAAVNVFSNYLRRMKEDRGTREAAYLAALNKDPELWSVPQSTLVLVAYLPPTDPRDEATYTHALASTLTSLEVLGMGRAVLLGPPSSSEQAWVQEALDLWKAHDPLPSLRPKRTDTDTNLPRMEAVVCPTFSISMLPSQTTSAAKGIVVLNTTTPAMSSGNIPKAVIEALQNYLLRAGNLRQNVEDDCWLGHRRSFATGFPFRYLYLTEPDLIFHSRPSSLASIGRQLQQERVVAAHRLQPIPHFSDLDFVSKEAEGRQWILPATPEVPEWSKVIPMEGLTNANPTHYNTTRVSLEATHACYDSGNHHKGLMDFPACEGKMSGTKKKMWWQCGFGRKGSYDTATDLRRKHKRLLSYRPFRLLRGTNLTTIAGANGRTCVPQ